MVRILLAEDQAMVRHGLKMMIETDAKLLVTGEAGNGEEALRLCEQNEYDLVIMDIRMPVMDGLEATGRIRKRWPELKILILTTFNDDEYALSALSQGANGYMLKNAEPERLIGAIRSCMDGGLSLEEQVAAKVVPRLLKPTAPSVHPDLTKRELEIVRQIGEGRSNREIAQELDISVGTVKNHISQVLDKLDVRDRTQLAIYAIRHNLV